MTILRVGPNSAYSEGWDAVFGGGKKLPKAAKPKNDGDPESPKPKGAAKAVEKKNLKAKAVVKTARKSPVKTSSSKSGTKVKKAVSKKASSKRVTTKKPKA